MVVYLATVNQLHILLSVEWWGLTYTYPEI